MPSSAASSTISSSRSSFAEPGGRTPPGASPSGSLDRHGRRVRRLVRGRELHPVLDLDLLRQLGEHVLLVAPQVDRRHRAAERLGAPRARPTRRPAGRPAAAGSPTRVRNSSTRFSIGVPVRNSARCARAARIGHDLRAGRVRVLDDSAPRRRRASRRRRRGRPRAAGPACRTSSRRRRPRAATGARPRRGRRRAGCARRARVCLAVSFSQLICTLAGQTTRNRRCPCAARWASAASAWIVLPSPISSPRIERSWWIAYCAPNTW